MFMYNPTRRVKLFQFTSSDRGPMGLLYAVRNAAPNLKWWPLKDGSGQSDVYSTFDIRYRYSFEVSW